MAASFGLHATKNCGPFSSSTYASSKSSNKCSDANNKRNSLSFGNNQSFSTSSTSKGDNKNNNNNNLMATHVATRLPPVIAPLPTPEKEKTKNGGSLTAWTSIKQERWEGELLVQGHIPSWLVCTILIFSTCLQCLISICRDCRCFVAILYVYVYV